jgi:hypothetical protein
MMRYFEYVYLLVAVCISVFIVVNYKNMTMTNVVMSSLGAGISAFMFSFRRSQRQIFERQEAEDLDKLKQEAEDGD